MKHGAITLRPIIDWDIPTAVELMTFLGGGGLAYKGEQMHSPFADKVNNTLQFSVYKTITQRAHGDPSVFNALSPMDVIQRNIAP